MKNTPFGSNSFDFDGLRRGMGTRRKIPVEGVETQAAHVGEIPAEWVLAPGCDRSVRLLYLHGGGFVSGSGGSYLPLAAHISGAAKCAVLLIDYRLAPEHRFPAGLDDCVQAHEWLRAHGPAGREPARATFVAGDSAGGNLALATLLALRDRKLALPSGVISISPAADLTLGSQSLQKVYDPIISSKTMPIFRDHYLGGQDPAQPLASPVFGDYRGLPPLLIQAGDRRTRNVARRWHSCGQKGQGRRDHRVPRDMAGHVSRLPIARPAAPRRERGGRPHRPVHSSAQARTMICQFSNSRSIFVSLAVQSNPE
jgi:acetyl esterase/lipase